MLPKLFNVGTYDSIEELWARFPNGGVEGEYATISGTTYAWDKYERNWKNVSDANSTTGGSANGGNSGTDAGDTNNNTNDNNDMNCKNCNPIINIYNGFSDEAEIDTLRKQVENSNDDIQDLREILQKLVDGTSGSNSSSNEDGCRCKPTTLVLTKEDFCTIELDADEAKALQETEMAEEMPPYLGNMMEQSNVESEEGEETGGMLTDVSSGMRATQGTTPTVCARISVPDGTLDKRLIALFINNSYAVQCTKEKEAILDLLG